MCCRAPVDSVPDLFGTAECYGGVLRPTGVYGKTAGETLPRAERAKRFPGLRSTQFFCIAEIFRHARIARGTGAGLLQLHQGKLPAGSQMAGASPGRTADRGLRPLLGWGNR